MGMVAMTYKINPDAEAEDVNADAIAASVQALSDDIYNVQSVEVKPLAFGLKFVQVHVVMDDGEGLADALESKISAISGVGEIEVLSMGLL
tara:strand:+ start:578 stop:850 length:273 start_codon:yes stop_codon:yes gene_type:complete